MRTNLAPWLQGVVVVIGVALASPSWAADFSGRWTLDLAASDSLDELLEAQGVGWVKRKAVAKMAVTQTITQTTDEVTVKVVSRYKEELSTLRVDGQPRTVSDERGQARVIHEWQGEHLVTTSTRQLGDGASTLTVHRSLSADGTTLTQRLTWQSPDGTRIVADRVFRGP
ncbi:MAG: hypothetical protein KTR31_10370 [Myxococcales bacterium]|nr:hypothetical protein [Myxococcales bacterium]